MPDKARAKKYLAFGGALTALCGLLLWLLPKLARKSSDPNPLDQAIGAYSSRNLALEIGLWCLLILGIALLIYGLKLRFPNPEHIQFEEEWKKKGR